MTYVARVNRHRTLISGYRYDTNVLGINQLTLFKAAKCGDIRQFEDCINDKVDLGLKTKDGRTALHIAVANRQRKFVKYLLEQCPYCIRKGADLDIQGLNALHICVINGDAEIYSLLMQAGFATAITTRDGKTVSELAKENHHTQLLVLMDVKQNIEVKDVLSRLQEKYENVQYGKLIKSDENVFVIYTDDEQLDGVCIKTAGIKTIYKNTNGFDRDNERAIDFELDMDVPGLTQKENELMKYVVDGNSDTLWRHHENLNGIRISAVRTTRGKAFRQNCIVLCCRFKGFLVEKEDEFPRKLTRGEICFPVDVREDNVVLLAGKSSDKLKPLACGGVITGSCSENKVCGTIGPFVELPNQETGFLTCAHVLDNNPAFGVVNGRNHLVYQPRKDGNEDPPCGEVVKMTFRPSSDPSIDAAVVKITSSERIPTSIHFVAFQQSAFIDADISEGVTFNTGDIGEHLPGCEVLKFGAFTPDLKYKSSGTGHEQKIDYPQGKVLMRGLSKIIGQVSHQKGDSGAGVFVESTKGKFECVGLFFAGWGREGYFIPTKDVLKQCGNYKLKTYV